MRTSEWVPFPGVFIRCTEAETGFIIESWTRKPGTNVYEYFIYGLPVNESLAEIMAMMKNSSELPPDAKDVMNRLEEKRRSDAAAELTVLAQEMGLDAT